MKILKTSTLISVIALSLASTSIYAQSEVSHNDAHKASGAEAIYEQWKNNKTRETDPFYRVARGYASDKSSASSSFFETQVLSRNSEYVSEEKGSLENTLNSRRSLRNESVKNAYSRAMDGNDDGNEFDHDTYLAEMESYLDARKSSSGLYYEQRQSAIAGVSVNTTAGLDKINNSVLSNSSQATYNLVELMQSKMSSKRADIYSAFEDNLADAELARAHGLAAQELAADFNSTCTACDFTENPTPAPAPNPPPEPEDPPSVTPPIERCGGAEYKSGEGWMFYECP